MVVDEQGFIDEEASDEKLYATIDGRTVSMAPSNILTLEGVDVPRGVRAARVMEIERRYEDRYNAETMPATAATSAVPAAPAASAAPATAATPAVAEDAARVLGVSAGELSSVIPTEEKGLSVVQRYEDAGDVDAASAIRGYVAERFGAAQPVVTIGGNDAASPEGVAPEAEQGTAEIPMETRGKEKRQAFHLVPVERTAEELYTAGLEQQEIDAFVQANLDEINADIETHNKKKPKMGANIAAYKEAKDKWQAVSDDLGARLDYYRKLQEHIKDIITSEMAEAVNAPVDEPTYYSILADENYNYHDTTRESETIGNSSEVLQGEESVSAAGIESVGERNEGREVPSDVQGGTETAAAQGEEQTLNVEESTPSVDSSTSNVDSSTSNVDSSTSVPESQIESENGNEKQTSDNIEELTDNQGNPVDENGKLIVEEVQSIEEITDEDFENPTRNVLLPAIPENVAIAIGAEGKPLVIKKNVFEKNGNTHVELEPEDSRNILRSALYNPNMVGSTQPIKRPDYKVAIRTGEKNAVVVLDVFRGKEHIEIVGWRMVNEKGLAKMQRQAEREGGQFLILSPNDGLAAALSALPSGPSSTAESTTQSSNVQENFVKSGENAQNEGEKDVIEEIKAELGILNRDNAAEYARRLFAVNPWNTLEEADAVLKGLLASYGEALNGQTLGVIPFLDEARNLISDKKVAEMREQNRAAEEIEKRAGRPPRPSDYATAFINGDANAQKAWEDRFNDYLDKLTADDLSAVESTIRGMQGNKEAIKAGNPAGYMENPNYKAFDNIEKMLKKRKRELEKSSTNVEKRQDVEDDSTTGGAQAEQTENANLQTERQTEPTISQESEQVALTKGAKWNATGEPEKMKFQSKRRADSHDVVWHIGKKRYGSTTAERDMLRTLAEDYGSLNAVWNAYELNQIILGKNEAAILKKLIETNSSKAELQQGSLSLDGENPAFKAATEQTMQALQKTGVEVVMATEEQVQAVMEIADDERQMIADANERFNRELDAFKEKQHKGLLHLGRPMGVLSAAGVNVRELTLSPKVLNRKMKQHGLTTDDLKGLAKSIQSPILVYKHGEKAPNIVVVTELDINNGKLSIALELDDNGNVVEVNNISSVHSKDAATELERLAKMKDNGLKKSLRWVEKEKVLNWFGIADLNSPIHTDNSELVSVANVINDFENPKVSAEFSRVYHGSGAKFDRFDHSFMGMGEGAQAFGWGTYVTEVEGIGRTYATSAARGKNIDYEKTSHAIAEALEKKIGISTGSLYIMYDGRSLQLEVVNGNNIMEKLSEYTGIPIDEKDAIRHALAEDAADLIEEYEHIGQRYRYTVEIPDDNGSNYLHWEGVVSDDVIDNLQSELQKNFGEEVAISANLKHGQSGEHLYKKIERALGSDKAASEFLNGIGFVGISYPALATAGGRADGARNYVIFNENDAQITDRVEFLRTSEGTVYGWSVGGRIYLTPEGVNPNTPVHEYTHLWASAIEQRNPELWAEVVEAVKLSPAWAEVAADEAYRNIWNDDSRMASEVLARLSGGENYRRTMQEAAERENDAARKFSLIAAWGRVKRALAKFWNKVREMLDLPVNGEPGNAVPAWERFVNSAIGDFYRGVNPNVGNSPMERMFIGEQGAENLDRAEEATTRMGMSEEEQQITDRAKADGTYMKAPNGKPTKLNPKQWVQVRTKAFKKWFGDWEAFFKKNFLLNGRPVATLTGDEFYPIAGKKLTDQVEDYFKSIGGNAVSPLFGNVILDRKGADDSLAHGMGRNKAVAYAAVKEVIENGVLVDTHTNHKGRGYDTAVIAAPILIGGERYICLAVVRRNANENRFYLHEVTAQKNLRNDAFVTNLAQKPASMGDLANILQNIVSASDDVSKVVDENGEPKILEHSTWNDGFYTFDIERLGESSGDEGVYGAGFYFGNVGHTQLYGDRAIQVYLDMKNPMNLPDSNAMEFFDYLVDNFDKEGLRDIVVKGNGKTVTMGKVVDTIKEIQANYDNGEYAELIESIRGIWSSPEDRVVEQKIFHKLGFAFYRGIAPFIEMNIGRRKFSEALRNAGYDGVIFDNREWVAFSPNQIKSATDNVGTFSSENADIRYRSFGGNSGYVGYSMSKRAAEARKESRYPKTDFKKEYGVSEMAFNALVQAGVIENSEWHHTSSFGNRTTFYSWSEPEYAEYYAEHKKEIDRLSRENKEELQSLLDSVERKANERREREYEDFRKERALRDAYEAFVKNLPVPETFTAKNGVRIVTNGSRNSNLWEFYRPDGTRQRQAGKPVEELSEFLSKHTPSFDKWKEQLFESASVEDNYSDSERFSEANDDIRYREAEAEAARIDAAITDAVGTLAAELHTPVEMVTDLSTLPDSRKRGAKGWYDGGRVYLVLANAESVQDAVETVLHEVVGHKGLRVLFGDGFDAMLDDVFLGSSKAVRSAIVERAMPLMVRGKGNAMRVATEEYMAEQAERGFDDYSLWERVKGWFTNMLRSLGIDVEIGDNEIRYMLWRSYRRMKRGETFAEELNNKIMEVRFRNGDGTIAKYESRVNTRGLSAYNAREAFQDEMLALKEFQRIVEEKYGEKIPSYLNVYEYENRMSSVGFRDFMTFSEQLYEPLQETIDEMFRKGATQEDVTAYLIAKSGLERNRDFSVRDYLAKMQESKETPEGVTDAVAPMTKAEAEAKMNEYMAEKARLLAELNAGSIVLFAYILHENKGDAILTFSNRGMVVSKALERPGQK